MMENSNYGWDYFRGYLQMPCYLVRNKIINLYKNEILNEKIQKFNSKVEDLLNLCYSKPTDNILKNKINTAIYSLDQLSSFQDERDVSHLSSLGNIAQASTKKNSGALDVMGSFMMGVAKDSVYQKKYNKLFQASKHSIGIVIDLMSSPSSRSYYALRGFNPETSIYHTIVISSILNQ